MNAMRPLGSSLRNQWRVNGTHADFVRPEPPVCAISVAATPQHIRFDIGRTALVIIDMQNDFCHPDGWLGSIGVDVSPGRDLVEPIRRVVAASHAAAIPVIWVNWGNRPDLLNLGPSTHHVYNGDGAGTGLGDPLANGSPVLELGSWAAAILDGFGDTSADVHVAKYSMSGFWDTPLDAILRNLGVTTLLFAGVNLDQCVMYTLQDASSRGYDCVLLEDCSATTSPAFCAEAALYNIRQCFGFVADGATVASAVEAA